MSSKDYVMLSFHDSLLRRSDVDLLTGPFWLNDTIISFYLEYLEKVMFINEKDLLFVSPQVTQCLKMVSSSEVGIFLEPLKVSSRRFIFMPLNDNTAADQAGGSHWSLLIYSRPERQFFHIDSLNDSNDANALILATHIFPYLSERSNGECNFTRVRARQQSNGYDCGIHVLCNVDLVAEHVLQADCVEGCGVVSVESADSKRKEMLDLISELANKD